MFSDVGPLACDRAAPVHDAVEPRVDRGRGNREIAAERDEIVGARIAGLLAGHLLIEPMRVGGVDFARERAAERDHRAHRLRLHKARSRANTPPRLQPTSETFRPVSSASRDSRARSVERVR